MGYELVVYPEPPVIKDRWFQPVIWLGGGFLGAVLAVSGIVRRLRRPLP
jgi:hypothetical protein